MQSLTQTRQVASDPVATVVRRPPVLVHITTVDQTLGFLADQVDAMRGRGFEVHVVSAPGPLLDVLARRGAAGAHPLPMSRRITPIGDLAAVVRLWRLLRRLRPQIVHAYTPKAGLLGMIAASAAGVPVRYYSVLGLPMLTAKGLRRLLLRSSERLACRLAHRVLGIGRSVREAVIAERLCPEAKIEVLRQGSSFGVSAVGRFDPSRYGPGVRSTERARLAIPESAPVVGFVGRLAREKGLAELATAWFRLRAEIPDLHLLIVGPDEPNDPLPGDVEARLRADDRVHFVGQVDEPAPYYFTMDVLAHPTHREGFGHVILEAASMGLPTVATRVSGCVDSVEDGVTGTLVPPQDPQALAAAIVRYLRDPALRAEHGRAGRERAIHGFRTDLLDEATFQDYVKLLRSKGLRLPPSPTLSRMGSRR